MYNYFKQLLFYLQTGIKDIHGTYYYLGYILFISTIINIALWIFEIVFRQKTLIAQ